MPLISVVVPIYNVEPFLRECLDSVASQTVSDLEVIMVDDGSTDQSAAIAREYEAADERFRLISQANAGLGAARNTGADAASGEYLAFVDSDDVLPRHAYELLLGALEKTGSDFATGNVHRLTQAGTNQAPFLARAFAQTRMKTHVTELEALLTDRIVPNKLWRRSFWDRHGYRFPEGMLHEDIPVVVPAHFAAKSVDVISDVVYLYRVREGSDSSITQRRIEKRALLDRVAGVEQVLDHLHEDRDVSRKARRWYEKSLVAHDLLYYLNVLDIADDDYRELFLERVNPLLDRMGRHVYRPLPAITRLKWHLVRRRLMPELVEVLRFQKREARATPPVRAGRRWYGDYPFREDRRLRIPRSVYRLREELSLSPRIEDVRFWGGALELRGYAFISGVGAPASGSQRVTISLAPEGRLGALRTRLFPIRLKVRQVERPDVTAGSRQGLSNVDFSGFEAVLPARRLRRLARRGERRFAFHVTVRAGGVTRRRTRFLLDGQRPVRATEAEVGARLVQVSPHDSGEFTLEVHERWAVVDGRELSGDGVARLSGRVSAERRDGLTLRLRPFGSAKPLSFPLALEGDCVPAGFSAELPVAEVAAQAASVAHDPRAELHGGPLAELYLADGQARRRVLLSAHVREATWPAGEREVALFRARDGGATIATRAPRGLVTSAAWAADGSLELAGELHGAGDAALVLSARNHRERHRMPLELDAASGSFSARVVPVRRDALGDELPLGEGYWDIELEHASGERAPLLLSQQLHDELPLQRAGGERPLALSQTPEQRAILIAQRDLATEERGRYHQRLLRERAYAARRSEPLRDVVVYSSFRGMQCSDSPRAIHEELVRRGAPLEHAWVVRDGRFRAPPGSRALRSAGREHYEALSSARYVVVNDHLPDWFERRPDQVVIQTWRGTPLKCLGADVPEIRGAIRRDKLRWAEEVANWQHVLSPNRFSTPVLERAYAITGELVETGYPRTDALAGPEREARGRAVRERLGIGEGERVVLYAPTFRDDAIDRHGQYRLDLRLDLAALAEAAGEGTVILFRKHPYVVDLLNGAGGSRVRDVSTYPDATDLLLAADVLVTDYCAAMFDFANTGRPMLFFTYDLESYRDEVRGFYFDFEARAPGPLLRTTGEVAEALADLASVQAEYAGRYRRFVADFCELDDGHAAERVVERLFSR